MHNRLLRPGMPHNIGQGFLHNPEGCYFDRCWKLTARYPVMLDLHLHAGLCGIASDML